MSSSIRGRATVLVAAAGLCTMLLPASASAGRVLATGHDADHHCGRQGQVTKPHEQCHFFEVAVNYVRGGAPDPSKPVLVLDRAPFDVVASLDRVFGPGMPRTVIVPRSQEFRTTPITTDRYSAIIIASSRGPATDPTPQDLNEVDSTPDSDAINARAGDLRAFFERGGGIYVNSGSEHGDDPNDPYYAFLPVTVRGAAVQSPFLLTAAGRALGMFENDVACCPTHNTFEPPSDGSALRAIDTDSAGRIVSVFAETQRFSSLAEPPLSPVAVQHVVKALPATHKCIRRATVKLRLRRPKGVRFDRANIYRDGKFLKRLRGKKITRPFTVRVPRKSRTKVVVRVDIYTTSKRKLTIRRTYKTCTR